MEWYQYLVLAAMAFCIVILAWYFLRLVKLGMPLDYSKPSGEIKEGIKYAFGGSMDPRNKECACLHIPTYTAGLIYHIGTFITMLLFLMILVGYMPSGIVAYILSVITAGTGISGAVILVKRLIKRDLRLLSKPDDYISNGLVTAFHIATSIALFTGNASSMYYILATSLFIYIPLGKLRHTVYFFAARYHLGFFFGRRGIWPPKTYKALD